MSKVPDGLEGKEAGGYFDAIAKNYSEENVVNILVKHGMKPADITTPQMKALLHFITINEYHIRRYSEIIKEQNYWLEQAHKKLKGDKK